MNILFITKEKLSYDEAPSSRILNLKKILSRYHSVYVIGKGKSAELSGDANIFTVPITGDDFLSHQIYKAAMFSKVLSVISQKKIDFVITREYYYVLLLKPFEKLYRYKIIYDMHCFRYQELRAEGKLVKSFFNRMFEPIAHAWADSIMAIGDGIRDDLSDRLRKKAFLMPNGVSLEEIEKAKVEQGTLRKYGIKEDDRLVGFIGNWMPWVDVRTFVESSRHLKSRAKLIVIGKDYAEKEYAEFRQRYPEIIMTGMIPHCDAIQLLKKMEICVLPYKRLNVIRHLSIRKTLEYLAAGKPIIMSDSDISEKRFLVEGKNQLSYRPEDPVDLAEKIDRLIGDRRLLEGMSKQNRLLSARYSWDYQVTHSDLFKILKTYDLCKADRIPKGKVTIIIKALNEEKHIARCIESALEAIKGLDGEILLVDSSSEDKTVEIAKKYPVRILQLENKHERCCGIGPQVGYLKSKSEYIYMLDGDMTLDRDFIKKALPYFSCPGVAGVGGNIYERSKENLAFQVRSKSHVVESTQEAEQLGMGGLYKREAIDDVGYFSDPYLYAYEEYDLGAELLKKGYSLVRIPEKMVEHFGDEISSIGTVMRRMRSGYLFGSGQYLRRSMRRRHYLKTLWELKIYTATLIWFMTGIACTALLLKSIYPMLIYLAFSSIFLGIIALRKRHLNKVVFSVVSWNFQAIGMAIGFFLPDREPSGFVARVRLIKDG